MKDLLGDDLFRKCLHAYMERWHGKHPTPWDFFYTFDDVSGRDLDWFWSRLVLRQQLHRPGRDRASVGRRTDTPWNSPTSAAWTRPWISC